MLNKINDTTKPNSFLFSKIVSKFVKQSCAINCVFSYEPCKLRHYLLMSNLPPKKLKECLVEYSIVIDFLYHMTTL